MDECVEIRRIHRKPHCSQMRSLTVRNLRQLYWHVIDDCTLGSIISINQSLTSAQFLYITEDQVYPLMFSGELLLYQQHNEPSHTGRILKECFEEHSSEFQVISWPLNSTVRNQVEQLSIVVNLEIPFPAAILLPRIVREFQDNLGALDYRYFWLTYKSIVHTIPGRVM